MVSVNFFLCILYLVIYSNVLLHFLYPPIKSRGLSYSNRYHANATIFLQVVVCHEMSTGDVFAMKIMKKAHILQQSDVRVCKIIID